MSETLDHDNREGLWVTDAELIRRTGLPERVVRVALHTPTWIENQVSAEEGFVGNRRYWPAVKAYFDRTNEIPKL